MKTLPQKTIKEIALWQKISGKPYKQGVSEQIKFYLITNDNTGYFGIIYQVSCGYRVICVKPTKKVLLNWVKSIWKAFFRRLLFCVFWIVVTPLIIFFLSDLAGFEFFCLFLPRMEHIEHGKVGGSLGLVQPETKFSVNLINVKSVKVF